MAQYLEIDSDGLAIGGIFDDNCPGFVIPDNWIRFDNYVPGESGHTPLPNSGWIWNGTNWVEPEGLEPIPEDTDPE